VIPQKYQKKCNVTFRYFEKPTVHAMQGTPRGVTWGQEVFLLEDFSRAGWGVIDPMGHHRKMGDFLEDLILLIVGVTLRINLTIIQSLTGDPRERHALFRKFGIGIENKVSCP
jgi:hypothetical protein